MKKYFLGFAICVFTTIGAWAVEGTPASQIHMVSTPGKAIINRISDNGKWAVATNYSADETEESSPGAIFNLSTFNYDAVIVPLGTSASWVSDISDDGTIVVGSFEGLPAYYNVPLKQWVTMPVTEPYHSGHITAVTPDGRYGVGTCQPSELDEQGFLWDLVSGKIIETPNLPTKDMTNQWQGQNRFTDISPDGRYILGTISFSYVMPAAVASYIYDRQDASYTFIGFTPNYTGKWKAHADGLFFISTSLMSPNGKYVTGEAYMVKESNEYSVTFVYNVETKEFEVYDNEIDEGIVSFAIDGNGVAYGCSPLNTPIRDWYVRNGNYWYPITDIMSQIYGKKLLTQVTADNSGTVNAVSNDGLQLGIFTDPRGEGYMMTTSIPLFDVCPEVDLLANYSFSPNSGAAFSTLTSITVKFDRKIDLIGASTSAKLVNSKGSTVRNSIGINIDGSTAKITFRPTELTVGETYSVIIPAGTFSLPGDRYMANREMKVEYIGRDQSPVVMTEVYPAAGTTLPRFDYYTSQILMVFNTSISFTGNEQAYLYMEGESEPIAPLYMAHGANQLLLYPATTQYLFKDNKYRVVLTAGSVADAGGAGPNEEISVEYLGSYEREISHDDKYLFKDDFSNGMMGFMFYEGDHQTPTETMSMLGFDSETPWFIGYDDYNYEDPFIMSHSAYIPAGTSDDWMMTPQLFIPDDICRLTFDAQSYISHFSDHLSVYVIPCQTVYNVLTDKAMAELRPLAVKVFDEKLDAGAQQETTKGEWTPYEVSLAQFAGQAVYIAFVNENTDQSLIFVDNICVVHDVRFLASVNTPETVVDKKSIEVSGHVSIESEVAVFQNATFELIDAEGNIVSTVEASGLNLAYKDSYSFTFPQELPLTVGVINNFSIRISLDEETLSIERSIKDLSFATTRRVVLEEFSGADCGNCPRGFLAVDNINELFPGKLIPVILRTYNGDPLSSGMGGYTDLLGFSYAPSGIIDRKVMCGPMAELPTGAISFSGEGSDAITWLDAFMDQLSIIPDADIDINPTCEDGKINVDCDITYALSNDNANVGLFTVVLEDGLTTSQENYLYNQTNPIYGEWGQGGLYGKSKIRNYEIDHVARGVFATSINGNIGLVPNKVEGGATYNATISGDVPAYVSSIDNVSVCVMMIDINTGRVINANVKPLDFDGSGIEGITASPKDSAITIGIVDGMIVANAPGMPVVLSLYSASGTLIATVSGHDTAAFDASAAKGLVIARAATAKSVKTAKIAIK